jgi:hypothetical protein
LASWSLGLQFGLGAQWQPAPMSGVHAAWHKFQVVNERVKCVGASWDTRGIRRRAELPPVVLNA